MLCLLTLLACADPLDVPPEAPTAMEKGEKPAEGDPNMGAPPDGKQPGDPNGDPNAMAGGPGAPPGTPGAPPGAPGTPPGGPDAPPADPSAAPLPPPAGGTPPGPGAPPVPVAKHPDKEFNVEAGKGVKVSGSVIYSGSQKGTVRVDFLRQEDKLGFPEIVGSLTLKAPGPFDIDVPQNLGKVRVVAYIDADGNGPSEGEAMGRAPKDTYDIEATPITGIDITLSDVQAPKGP